MNKEQQKAIEIHQIVNMLGANAKYTYFLIPNYFHAILMPHPQMPAE